jgi:hypothetical protein
MNSHLPLPLRSLREEWSVEKQVSYHSGTNALLTGFVSKEKGLGSVTRGGRQRPDLSQIERVTQYTLSDWKEDDEEVDGLILDNLKDKAKTGGAVFILRECSSPSVPH